MRKLAGVGIVAVMLASPLCYARNINRSLPPVPPVPPPVAAQWGFTKSILYDDFSDISTVDLGNQRIPGFKWYLNSRFQLVSSDYGAWSTALPEPNDPAYFTYFKGGFQFLNIPVPTATVSSMSNCYPNPNAGPLSGTVTGLSWTGGFYAEIQMQIQNVTHNLADSWPAFFTGGQVEFGNGEYNSAGDMVGLESVEEDVVETVPINGAGHNGLPTAQPNMHHWIFTTSTNGTSGANDTMPGGPTVYGTPNMSLPHTYGILQVPSSLTTNGLSFTHFVLDGVDKGGESYSPSTAPVPALSPDNEVGFLTRTLVEHHCVLMASGRYWPNLITKIQVWQAP